MVAVLYCCTYSQHNLTHSFQRSKTRANEKRAQHVGAGVEDSGYGRWENAI